MCKCTQLCNLQYAIKSRVFRPYGCAFIVMDNVVGQREIWPDSGTMKSWVLQNKKNHPLVTINIHVKFHWTSADN